jgi:ribosomal protein L16 Arg81 hydroxylase
MINNRILSICKTLDDYQYFSEAVQPLPITWVDVYEYFIPHTIRNVELIRNGKIDIPLKGLFQDRDFILNQIAQDAMFCITNFWNINYSAQTLWECFCDNYPAQGVDFHLYGGLSANAQSFPPHNDFATNYIVQLDGSCEWTIYNERATAEEAYNYVIYPVDQLTVRTVQILNPGDVIYIPRGVHHSCRPLGKRLSLSIPIL